VAGQDRITRGRAINNYRLKTRPQTALYFGMIWGNAVSNKAMWPLISILEGWRGEISAEGI
jgi:hypothetical protein